MYRTRENEGSGHIDRKPRRLTRLFPDYTGVTIVFGGQLLRIGSKAYEEEDDSGIKGRGSEERNMRVKTRKHRVVALPRGELGWVDAWRKRTKKEKEKGRVNSTNMVSKNPEMNRPGIAQSTLIGSRTLC